MTELRQTETNAADDSSGRAFGLDGNLYVPVLVASVVGLGIFAILGYGLRVGWTVAGLTAGVPWAAVLAWVLGLKQGRPAGYDRDVVDQLLGGGDFTRPNREPGRQNP